jgi:hypothetical protein
MNWLEWFELLSYVVTVIGFPLAILSFLYEKRRERQTDEEELYQRLSDEYADFLKLALENADLQLLRKEVVNIQLSDEQKERKYVLFEILVALFERAYILVYEERMSKQTRRLWSTWEDYMREWCRRKDFRELLPELLQGEDPEFVACITKISSAHHQA